MSNFTFTACDNSVQGDRIKLRANAADNVSSFIIYIGSSQITEIAIKTYEQTNKIDLSLLDHNVFSGNVLTMNILVTHKIQIRCERI